MFSIDAERFAEDKQKYSISTWSASIVLIVFQRLNSNFAFIFTITQEFSFFIVVT